MGRWHLVELEDLWWIPAPIRDAVTGYLQATIDLGDPYAPIVPKLAAAVQRSGATRVVDLCSGGGGPWKRLRGALEAAGVTVPLLLTDRYPNRGAAGAVLAGEGTTPVAMHDVPVDATHLPPALGGFRTIFTAFHHFVPDGALAILRDAVAHREPIGIFEATKRNATCIAFTLLTPLVTLLMMPRVRPFRWTNLLFTYLIPVVPLMVVWDGVVSCLRTYDVTELRALAGEADPDGHFDWEIGESYQRGPIPVTYLIGTPRHR